MHSLTRRAFYLAICLSALAGCVDAIGFLYLGGHFISFMSGNSTQLAVSLVSDNIHGVALLAEILALFVIGTTLGTLVRHFSKPLAAEATVIAFVALLLFAAVLCHGIGFDRLTIIFMTLAMGAENAVFQRNGDVVIGLTYMTGTLVKVGQRLAHTLLGGKKFAWLPYFLLWLGLILGGVAGAVLFHFIGLQSLWIAAIWAGALSLIARFSNFS